MMPTLTITRGLPGCGKTTRAREWVAQDVTSRARINRDDFRAMTHNGFADQERTVTAARDAAITALLKRGIDVIADDTCLPQRHARDLRRLAQLAGADFEVWDMTDVGVEVCVDRDALRPVGHVGEKVIRDMHQRYLAGKSHPLPLPDEDELHPEAGQAELYMPLPDVPNAIMVDIDGTVALMRGRSPYDASRVHEDRPNMPVIDAVRAMHAGGYRVVFCSGRVEACREATEKWLAEYVAVPWDALHMRADGDIRKDSIVKTEIFDRHIRNQYAVRAVFDDRNQVVQAWRTLGLTVFQVADGDF